MHLGVAVKAECDGGHLRSGHLPARDCCHPRPRRPSPPAKRTAKRTASLSTAGQPWTQTLYTAIRLKLCSGGTTERLFPSIWRCSLFTRLLAGMLLRKRALVGLQGELAAALLQSELASTPGRRRAQLADRSAGAEGRTFQAEGRRDFTSVFDCPAPGGVRSAEAAAARSARAAVPAARQGSAPEQRAAAGRGVQHALWPQRACVASCRCPRCRLLGTHRYSSATKSSCRCVRCRVLGTHSYSSATVDDKAREVSMV